MRLSLVIPSVALLTAAMLTALPAPSNAALPAPPGSAQAATTTPLVVDFADLTGPVKHGGHGLLYGLSDDGVPSDNLLAPLHLRTIAQKAPDGRQHPNGDALAVADAFLRNGGDYIQVYMQDIYSFFPYEDLGLADYLAEVDAMIPKIESHPDAASFVYVPFNEPDWIWYGLNADDPARYATNRDRFLADWTTVYRRIRAVNPKARIAGPNEAYYDRRFLPEFLAFAKANDVLPDVLTWHELPTGQLAQYRGNFADYRALEQRLGIAPIPININEWGGRRDLSVPGRMLQFIAMFEDTKVDAGGQAYWNPAGNLSGSASQANRPTGGWWLMKMYGELSGRTARLTPPLVNGIDTLQGVAAIDTGRRQARVLVGGGTGGTDVQLRGLDPAVFGDSVHLTVARTEWSGYDADAPPPAVLREAVLPLVDGALTVPLRGLDDMAAYEIVLSPGATATPSSTAPPWRAQIEAENAAIVSGTITTQGTVANWNQPAASGVRDVNNLSQPDSAVTFTVTVPADGPYDLGILYGTRPAEPSQQVLRIDGRFSEVLEYPATLEAVYRARKDVPVTLTAGTHTITLAKSDPTSGTAVGVVSLDRLDVTQRTGAPVADRYEAERSQPTGAVTFDYTGAGHTGAGHITVNPGARTLVPVSVPSDGYYDVTTRFAGTPPVDPGQDAATIGQLQVDGAPEPTATLPVTAPVDQWQQRTHRLYLTAGAHRLEYAPTGTGPLRLDAVSVVAASGGAQPRQVIEAEDAARAGTARIEDNAFASGGRQVTFVGNGGGNTLTLSGIEARTAGRHVLLVRYANNERTDNNPEGYNIVSRAIDISVNGAPANRTWFRNTWSYDNWWTVGVEVDLRAGTNEVRLANPTAFSPNLDRFEVAPLSVP